MGQNDKVQGEGDYQSARRYDEATREYVKTHDVEQEARKAAPADATEKQELDRAEEAGRARTKGEDPAVSAQDDRTSSKV